MPDDRYRRYRDPAPRGLLWRTRPVVHARQDDPADTWTGWLLQRWMQPLGRWEWQDVLWLPDAPPLPAILRRLVEDPDALAVEVIDRWGGSGKPLVVTLARSARGHVAVDTPKRGTSATLLVPKGIIGAFTRDVEWHRDPSRTPWPGLLTRVDRLTGPVRPLGQTLFGPRRLAA